MVITEALSVLWTAGMSHSSVDDSLVKKPACPLSLPISSGSEEEEEDELQNCRDLRENGLYGQEEEHEDVEEAREG